MKQIISASRRTDIPRWYLKDTIEKFKKGFFYGKSTWTGYSERISLKPENVNAIVWWSKDYSEWIKNADVFDGYNNFFQFTLNGYSDSVLKELLEPNIQTTLVERLEQALYLSQRYSPSVINWRFDPICFWADKNGCVLNNLGAFGKISRFMGDIGIERCIISFATLYPKVMKRGKARGIEFLNLNEKVKQITATRLATENKKNGIETFVCSDRSIVNPPLIKKSHCIDGDLLNDLFDLGIEHDKDKHQRKQCGCTYSIDMGSYDQTCKHNCLYCYANILQGEKDWRNKKRGK